MFLTDHPGRFNFLKNNIILLAILLINTYVLSSMLLINLDKYLIYILGMSIYIIFFTPYNNNFNYTNIGIFYLISILIITLNMIYNHKLKDNMFLKPLVLNSFIYNLFFMYYWDNFTYKKNFNFYKKIKPKFQSFLPFIHTTIYKVKIKNNINLMYVTYIKETQVEEFNKNILIF